jgi:ATP-dependent DNA helicase RecQ
MGVDKSNIRTVAHMDVPSSVEAYLQETGRAGRDGEPSKAVLFLSAEDRAFLGRIPEETERRRYASMLGYASGSSCRRNTLLSLIGQDQVACSGCDACAGAVVARPAGESEMLSFVRAHRRRFTPGRAAAILAGKCDPRSIRNFDDCREGFGTLASWESEDVEAGLWQLVAEGRLRLPSRGPWKGRLTTSRPRTIAPEAI